MPIPAGVWATLAMVLRTGAARRRLANLPEAMHLHCHLWGSVVGLMAVPSSPDAAGASAATLQSEVESELTERYQTTVPQPVRRALGLRKRGRIRYSFRANGEVVLQVQQKKLLYALRGRDAPPQDCTLIVHR